MTVAYFCIGSETSHRCGLNKPRWKCRALGSAIPPARRRTLIWSHTEQHWRDVRDQVANVEAGRDTLIVSIELKRRRAVHECPEPDRNLLGVGRVAVLAAVGRHLVDHVLQALFAALVDLLGPS